MTADFGANQGPIGDRSAGSSPRLGQICSTYHYQGLDLLIVPPVMSWLDHKSAIPVKSDWAQKIYTRNSLLFQNILYKRFLFQSQILTCLSVLKYAVVLNTVVLALTFFPDWTSVCRVVWIWYFIILSMDRSNTKSSFLSESVPRVPFSSWTLRFLKPKVP